jgi:hypothetical protein
MGLGFGTWGFGFGDLGHGDSDLGSGTWGFGFVGLAPILFGEEKFEEVSSILRERFQHDIQLRLEILSIRALSVCPWRSRRLGRCWW